MNLVKLKTLGEVMNLIYPPPPPLIKDQTDRINATGRDEPVDRSEVTSHMLSEAFINMQSLENVANCLPPLVHDGGGAGMARKYHPQGNLTSINTKKSSKRRFKAALPPMFD